MGDSDDEYDRRRGRDKFRRERSDYQERGGREERTRGRDDWVDRGRDNWQSRDRNRRDYRDYDTRRRDRNYSPQRHDMSPPMKKMRGRDNWEDRGGGYNYDMGYGGSQQMGQHHQGWGGGRDREDSSRDRGGGGGGGGGGGRDGGYDNMGPGGHQQHGFGGLRELDMGPTQPPMMTFKQFLASQDDSIGDEEAVRKYNEYKLEFKKQQLNEFFLNHKEEEWNSLNGFKSKYHPEECCKKRSEQLVSIRRRVETFMDLLEKRKLENVSIDIEKADDIIKFLDAVVIKLEGGTEIDLNLLDEPLAELEKLEKQEKQEKADLQQSMMKEEKSKKEKAEMKDPPQIEDTPDSSERPPESHKSESEDRSNQEGEKKRNRSKQYKFEEKEEENISESESDLESAKEVSDAATKEKPASHSKSEEGEGEDEKVGEVTEEKPTKEEKEVAADDESSADEERVQEEEDGVNGEQEKVKADPPKIAEDEATKESEGDKQDTVSEKLDEPPKPRLLHRTCSIFLRNLAPSITKQEVEAMCRRYPGFLRVAIADPQPERRFFRRGWVTFERSVNIKEICWNLNSIRLRDCELGASVNRDLTRRIRACSGVAAHKQVVKADIKMAARVIQHLDGRHELWADVKEKADSSIPSFGLISRNPLLKNITDYLIEEASAEEEELLGLSNSDENKNKDDVGVTTLERDEALIKVLDRLLMYLRIVHSVDYYNHSDYPNEDEMPNRCGIMHARGSPPLNRVTQNEINEHIASFELKVAPFLQTVVKMVPEEAVKLGEKDPEAEVEKFIVANTQELAKDKWLCPLSGKKFKGPEFVRKHIFNKHGEKIEEVKKEVEYFNNYLRDPKRPQLPEHPGNRPPPSAHAREGFGPQAGFQPPLLPPPPPQHFGYGGYNQQSRGAAAQTMFQGFDRGGSDRGGHGDTSFRGRGNFFGGGQKRGGGRARGDPREIVGYQDLDAPDDLDLF